MKTHLVLSAALLAAAAAGCAPAPEESNEVSLEQRAAGQSMAANVEDAASSLAPPSDGQPAGFAGEGGPGGGDGDACFSVSGNLTDDDQDGIPAQRLAEWNCAAASASIVGFDLTEDTDPLVAGFRFTRDRDMTGAVSNGTYHRVASFDADDSAGYTVHATAVVDASYGSYTVHDDYDWTLNFTPAAGWVPGTAPAGTFTIDGSWSSTIGGSPSFLGFDTLEPLVLDAECPTHVVSGKVVAAAVSGTENGDVLVVWLGCGNPVVLPYNEEGGAL